MSHDPKAFDHASELGALVAGRRKSLGLRQEDLAELADVSHRFVQALEAGKETVRMDKVMSVLSTLGWHLAVSEQRQDG